MSAVLSNDTVIEESYLEDQPKVFPGATPGYAWYRVFVEKTAEFTLWVQAPTEEAAEEYGEIVAADLYDIDVVVDAREIDKTRAEPQDEDGEPIPQPGPGQLDVFGDVVEGPRTIKPTGGVL